jgi:hypothetical protein
VPPQIPALFARAGVLVTRAFASHGDKVCARLGKATGLLKHDIKRVKNAVHRKKAKVSLDCATALSSVLSDARVRVQAERTSRCLHRR